MFVELSSDAAWILSDGGVIDYANDGAASLLGLAGPAMVGQNLLSYSRETSAPHLQTALADAADGPPQVLVVQLRSLVGADVYLHAKIFKDPLSQTLWMVGSDLSLYAQKTQDLLHRATHDSLTGLPNRDLLHERLGLLIAESAGTDLTFATVCLDLDGFKKANDAFGHLAGDDLLKELSVRIKSCLREGDTVSRTGGDEFVLILPNASATAAEAVCNRVLSVIRRPVKLQGQNVYVSASMGIAMYPAHGATCSELVQRADQAMYAAKHQGKNQIALYKQELDVASASQWSLDAEMHAAINNGEFLVYYQPIVDAQGQLKGCEALLRWQRPDGSFISPGQFIPAAESNGLITLLGDYVLRSALSQLKLFEAAGLTNLYMSINVSPRQLRHPSFERNLTNVLIASKVNPQQIVLEITESMLMSGEERTKELLYQISRTGVQFALDDFGTGYSCLAYLKTYPIAVLKIDRSFVVGIDTDPVSLAIVKAVISLAKALGLRTVVEGIETQPQAAALKGLQVDYMQGYLFCRPIPPADLIAKFAKN